MDTPDEQQLICALSSTDVRKQREAARALGRLRSKTAVGQMLVLLDESTNNTLREQIVNALGRIRDPRAITPLANLIDDPKLRRPALAALWRLGVFRDIGRGRMFKRALMLAKPEIKDLIVEGRLSRETILDVLPPMT